MKKAQSDSFPTGATGSKSFGGMSGNPASFDGMFDGVPGTFECTNTAVGCTLMTDAKGGLIASAELEMWTFSPNSYLATVKVPDASYTYFGWWLNKPKANDDPHVVEVFAGGTDGHAATVNVEIEGTATYAGPAAGKYVTKTFSAGAHSDSGVGHFTATANLTAKFGTELADNDGNAATIGGTVTGFVLDDVTAAPWKVILEDANLTDTDENFNGTTEVDFGGGATATDGGGAGDWQGSFYDDADTDDLTPSVTVRCEGFEHLALRGL